MKSKITNIAILILSIVGITTLNFATTSAIDVCKSDAIDEVKIAAGCKDKVTTKDNATNLIVNILNWVMGIIGMVAVVAIVIGGVQFMTSTGDAGKVKKARDTIIYAVIGLIVVGVSAAVVNLVINITTKSAPVQETTTQEQTQESTDTKRPNTKEESDTKKPEPLKD